MLCTGQSRANHGHIIERESIKLKLPHVKHLCLPWLVDSGEPSAIAVKVIEPSGRKPRRFMLSARLAWFSTATRFIHREKAASACRDVWGLRKTQADDQQQD